MELAGLAIMLNSASLLAVLQEKLSSFWKIQSLYITFQTEYPNHESLLLALASDQLVFVSLFKCLCIFCGIYSTKHQDKFQCLLF